MTDATSHDPRQALLPTALTAAREAAARVMEIYGQDFDVEYKDDRSPLTEADRDAHAIITRHLAATGLPVLSEESREIPHAERAPWTRFWLVDPVDGTKEFVNRTGEFTVNIALVDGSRPVLGVVLAPVPRTVYWGVVGDGDHDGAFMADDDGSAALDELRAAARPVRARREVGADEPLRVVASRSHLNEETSRFIDQLADVHPDIARVSRGSSLKLCMIASGEARIYPRVAPTMEWDTGAAQAIVEAAGAGVYEFEPDTPAVAYLDPAARASLKPLRYNKSSLRNPYFVAC
ncbi:3'(2'),5'-bisphosphate nucleotidase CysQ [bacterium]|nr:3'(2'),5'-bisphosphate nucleotidase CysQ [bacterium]